MSGGYDATLLRVKRTYTLEEAVEYMKMLDRSPTTANIRWRNARTGRLVAIGYT